MKKSEIRKMLSDIIAEVDYDIWKERFCMEMVFSIEELNENYKYLEDIVEHYLENNTGEIEE